MNSRRTIILLVAIVVGAIASFGLLTYVRGLEDSANEDAALDTMWVVTQEIPRGMPGETAVSGGFITQQEVPVQFKPSTAVGDPAVELAGLVAVTDLPINAPLVANNFVTPAVITTGVTDRLEEKGMTTFTMTLDQVAGAAYMIQPGDFVNVLAVMDANPEPVVPGDGEAAAAPEEAEILLYSQQARYLYQAAEVLAIDNALPADLGQAEAEGAPANLGLITLAVPPEVVQLLLSVGPDRFYLSLIPQNYAPRPLPQLELTPDDSLPGEDETRLTPTGPRALAGGAAAAAAQAATGAATEPAADDSNG